MTVAAILLISSGAVIVAGLILFSRITKEELLQSDVFDKRFNKMFEDKTTKGRNSDTK